MKIGEVYKSNVCGNMHVVGKLDKYCVVCFDEGTEIKARPQNIRNGAVRNPNHKTVCGVGYVGIGDYSRQKTPTVYSAWINMIRRCYDEAVQKAHPTYKGCSVASRWHNLQLFAYGIKQMIGHDKLGQGWQLDKDILYKNNGKYSRKTCVLVPAQLNSVLTKSDNTRSSSGIGVSFRSNRALPFIARCNINGKTVKIGAYATAKAASSAYVYAKESELKRLANMYKDELDPRAYKALCCYKVDPND